jgi:hypothetical protein
MEQNVVEINGYEYNDVFKLRGYNNVIFESHNMKYINLKVCHPSCVVSKIQCVKLCVYSHIRTVKTQKINQIVLYVDTVAHHLSVYSS